MTDFKDAQEATAYLFHLIDACQTNENEGHSPDHCDGLIEFEDIDMKSQSFPYPRLHRGLNFNAKSGESVVIVGRSTQGKTMLFHLLEKFYRPTHGSILLDCDEVTHLNTNWVRRQISYVPKDPQLFSSSIRENIAYGDKSRYIDMNEIEEVAKKVGLHEFVETLPLGYETACDGFFLTEEQKQQIALARAMVRDPRILLLDDITIGMNADEEMRILTVINEVKKDRTCIYITSKCSAHLSTFDRVALLSRGIIAETGSHIELMDHRNLYYKLYESHN